MMARVVIGYQVVTWIPQSLRIVLFVIQLIILVHLEEGRKEGRKEGWKCFI